MLLSKLLKSMKSHSYLLQYFVAIFPIFLVFGVLWQITMLSKYNAIVFFSWGQVLNDTSALLPQFIILILWSLSAYIYYLINISEKEKWGSIWLLCLFFGIFLWIILWILKNSYLSSFICSFFLWYLSYVTIFLVWDKWKKTHKNENYYMPVILMILVLAIVLLFWSILSYFYSFLYQNIEIKINSQNNKINYMNDKYIFYSSWEEIKIIPNDWENEFIIKDIINKKN